MKQCIKCDVELTSENWCQYHKENCMYICNKCHQIRQKKYRQSEEWVLTKKKYNKKWEQKKKEVLHRLKINGCAICSYNECDASLDFHHTNPGDKKFALDKRGISKRDKNLVEELNKCILLCANCHRKIHYEELD